MQLSTAFTVALGSIFTFDVLVLVGLKLTWAKPARVLGMALFMSSPLLFFGEWLAISFFSQLSWLFVVWVTDVDLIGTGITLFLFWVPGPTFPLHISASF